MKYENLKKVALSYFTDFSSISKKILNRTISICDSLDDESDKIFRLRNALNDCLWDIPETVEDGFREFINTKFKLRLEAITYHELNSDEYERKEPRIYQKPLVLQKQNSHKM